MREFEDNMLVIKMVYWGKYLSSRRVGDEVRQVITSKIRNSDDLIGVDFSGVESVSWGFADECFGRMSELVGYKTMNARLRFINADKSCVAPVLGAAVKHRAMQESNV